MNFIKHPVSLDICEVISQKQSNFVRHSQLLPNSIRCIICGPSNCGKTNVIISLLFHENGLKFKNVYLYSKTIFQAKYQLLENVLQRVPEVSYFPFNDSDQVIHPNDALPNAIFIFDDVACENQSNIRNYFSMGRHNLIDCFYLTQTYSKIPKQLIRDNVNFLIVFKQDEINLKHIYIEHVNTDISWLKFKEMCSKIWEQPYNFLIINKDCSIHNGRYRQMFDTFIQLD